MDDIHKAATLGHVEILQQLLNSGASVNDRDSVTPLHEACGRNEAEIVEELLKCDKIDILVEDIGGNLPQDCSKDPEIVKLFEKYNESK